MGPGLGEGVGEAGDRLGVAETLSTFFSSSFPAAASARAPCHGSACRCGGAGRSRRCRCPSNHSRAVVPGAWLCRPASMLAHA